VTVLRERNRKKAPAAPPKPAVHWRDTMEDDRMAHLIRGVGRGLVRALQMRLHEHGVAHGHWTFLRVLWRTDGLTQRQLSEQAGVMEPTTFSAVQAMERLGYVTRQRLPGNRKQVRVFLTLKGAALRGLLEPLAEEVNRVALTGVPRADVAATRRTLLTMIGNLADDEVVSSDKNLRMPSTREIAQTNAGGEGASPKRSARV
jgi:DNA-binding MarR family transcriptional regulator